MLMKKIQYTFFYILIVAVLSACQTSTNNSHAIKHNIGDTNSCGVTQGSFLGSWFDYYERGLSFADCQMWYESEQDLQKALSKRSVDKRRVYSLGMHLINDYFPNRELGIAFFYQKKYIQAENQLKISLSQFPTSKAEEYLTRVRSIQLIKSNADTQAPIITITSPSDNSIQTASTIHVTGFVKDDSFIDKVVINGMEYRHTTNFTTKSGVPVRVNRKVSSLNFSIDVPILYKEGSAVIDIKASDISGKVSNKIINLKNKYDPDCLFSSDATQRLLQI